MSDKKQKKNRLRTLKWALLFSVPIILSTLVILQRVVKKQLINELNNQLEVKVLLHSVEISGFSDFPNIGVRFNKLRVNQSREIFEGYLLEASNISVVVNAWDLVKGKNTIEKIQINDGELRIFEDRNGNNYSIFKSDTSKSASNEENTEFEVDLKKVVLQNVRVVYENKTDQQSINFFAEKLNAKAKYTDHHFYLSLLGSTVFDHFEIEGTEYLLGKRIQMDLDIEANQNINSYAVNKGDLLIDGLPLTITGTALMNKGKPNLDIKFESKNANIKGLIALLPKDMAYPIRDWNSDGKLNIEGTANGLISAKLFPKVDVKFSVENGTLVNDAKKVELGKLALDGTLSNGDQPNIESLKLDLNISEFKTQKSALRGSLKVPNFGVPNTKFVLKGYLYLEDINSVFNATNFQHGKVQMNTEGTLRWDEDLQNFNYNKSAFFGDIELTSLDMNSGGVVLKDITASGRLKGRDWNNVKIVGNIQGSDFNYKGRITDWTAGVFSSDVKRPKLFGDLKVEDFNLNQFLSFGEDDNSRAYNDENNQEPHYVEYDGERMLDIGWDANLKVEAKSFVFDKMKFSNVKMNALLRENLISIPILTLKAMDGDAKIKTSFVQEDGRVIWNSNFYLNHILISELFEQFNNFQQDEITSDHLSGYLTTETDINMEFDHHWNAITEDLILLAKINVKDGNLKGYKPLESLSKFVEVEDLMDVKFSELKNVIKIEDETILIPSMNIKNSALNLELSGSHTFENELDYKIKLSLTELLAKKSGWIAKRKQKQLESAKGGGLNAYILLKGTPDNLDIKFDKKSVKQQIKKEAKAERKRFFEDVKKEIRGERISTPEDSGGDLWDE